MVGLGVGVKVGIGEGVKVGVGVFEGVVVGERTNILACGLSTSRLIVKK